MSAMQPSHQCISTLSGLLVSLLIGALACSGSKDESLSEKLGQHSAPALTGDLDRDRAVTIVDLQLLANVLLGLNDDPLVLERADYDDNGVTDVSDLQKLVNLLLSCSGSGNACTCAVGSNPVVSDASGATGGTARYTTDVRLVDIDNDGDLDIVWANQFNSGVEPLGGIDISINQGNRSFETRTLGDENTIGAWTFVEVADVTGDGFVDIVATRPANSVTQIALFENDQSGWFSQNSSAVPPLTGPTDGLSFGRAAIADVDLDGNADIIVPIAATPDFTDDQPNVLLMNNGSGGFARDTSGRLPELPDLSDFTFCIAVGDVNRDGAADIFLGEAERRQRLLINDGQGHFSDQTEDDGNGRARMPSDSLRGYACEMLDVDEDGDLDVVIANDVSLTSGSPVAQAAYLYENDGSAYFSASALPFPSGGPYDGRGIAMGDINGDKLPDLLLSHDNFTIPHEGNALQLLLGQCDGSHAPATDGLPSLDKGVLGVAVGDLDGDGRADIAAAVSSPDGNGDLSNVLLFAQ